MRLAIIILFVSILTVHLASAQSITGQDLVEGFGKPTDVAIIQLPVYSTAQLSPHLLNNRISIRGPTGIANPTCTQQSAQSYQCTYRERYENAQGARNYYIEIRDADNNIINSYDLELTIDQSSPVFTDADIIPRTSSNNQFSVILRARDRTIDSGTSTTCAGIQTVSVTAGTNTLYRKEYLASTCSINEAQTISLPNPGTHLVCLTIVDFLGARTSQCYDVTHDVEGPQVDLVGYGSPDGKIYRHLTSQGANLLTAVKLSDPAGITHVRAQFDAYHQTLREPTLIVNNTYYFGLAQTNPATPCTATIEATDSLGNTARHNQSCTALTDDMPPRFETLNASYEDSEGRPTTGRQGHITVTLVDDGAGVDPTSVEADFSLAGGGRVIATKCVDQATKTICTFENVSTSIEGDYLIPITAQDYAGNTMRDEDILQVLHDIPIIKKIEQSPTYLTFNDPGRFIITVQSQTDVVIRGTLSENLDPTQHVFEGQCGIETAQGEWTCVLSIPSLPNDRVSGTVTVILEDSLKTTTQSVQDIEVFAIGSSGAQDLIDIRRVTTSPRAIDRRVASQIAYPIYIRPELRLAHDEVEILDIVSDCQHPDIVDGPRTLYATTAQPYIAIKLARETASNESISRLHIPCTLDIATLDHGALVPERERENFTVTITYENLPLGTIDQSIKDKLAGIDAEIQNIERDIGKWENTNEALTSLRDTASLVAQTDAALSIVSAVIWGISTVLYKTGLLTAQAATLWESTCSLYVGKAGSTGIHHLINLAIWHPGNIPGSIVLPLPKNAALIQSCQLCGFGGSLNAVVPATEGEVIVDYDGDSGKPTTLEAVSTFNWEPFKSIHVAQACLCPPAIEYNLRKERQVRCIYRNCVEEASALGLPFSHCDQTLVEQNCLYVDGAAWKIAGGAATAAAMRDLLANILAATPTGVVGTAWSVTCSPIQSILGEQAYSCNANGGDPLIDFLVPICGTWAATLELAETDFYGENKFGWDTFNGLLEGEDFCVE